MSTTTQTKNILDEILASLPSAHAKRKEAAEALKKTGLPSAKSEEYKHTPITRALEKNFDFTTQQKTTPAARDFSSAWIENLDAHKIVFVNGVFNQALSTIDSTDFQLDIFTENEWPEALGSLSDIHADPFVAWNTAVWTQGILIRVPDNTQVSKPVIVYHLHDAEASSIQSVNRMLIHVGKGASLTVIEKQDSRGQHNAFSSLVTEVFVKQNAAFDLYTLQSDAGNRFHFNQTTIHQTRDSRANTFILTLDGKFIRNNLQVILDGENCESHLHGLYLVHNDTLVDNHTVVDHRKANAYSNELYKGVIDDKAKGVFNGKIFVRPNAQKTNAFQSNRNIILSVQGTVNTKPQLEIWADDVKCSHGCTTGQLDEEALFYLQTRGISKDTARAMMLYAFSVEVLDIIKNDTLKEYIDQLVGERLHKNF